MIRFLAASAVAAARSTSFWLIFVAAFFLVVPIVPVRGDITPEGDVSPADPSTWTSATVGYIGNTASGTLTVDGTSSLQSGDSFMGYHEGTVGAVNVVGTGATWTNSGCIYVGSSGSGTLSITNGGNVSASDTCVGQAGAITVEGSGSQLGNAYSLYAAGTLSITNGGTVNTFFSCVNGTKTAGLVIVDGPGSTWNAGNLQVGYANGSGTLLVTNGGSVTGSGYIGEDAGAAGVVRVDGARSTWSDSDCLYVGDYGNGTLSISNGGSVSVARYTKVGAATGSEGEIDFGSGGGTLTTQSLFVSPGQLSGTGTVNAAGLVSDIDLKFDSAHGPKQVILFQQSGQRVTVILDMATHPSTNGTLGAGWIGSGTLTIQDGKKVTSNAGYLGCTVGSIGTASISGWGSTWDSGSLYVGSGGSGTLSITNAGTLVSNGGACIGNSPGSAGLVTVDGSSSTWRNGDPLGATTGVNLLVGNSGGGTLSITNGGSVSVTGATYLAACVGATGVVNLGDSGGTLTTQSLFASPNQLLGTGTVNTRGLVADSNLLFGAGHAPTQTVTLRGAGQNVTINLDMTLGFGNSTNGFLGAGWKGSGSLTIQDGIEVDSASGYLGYGSGSTGTAVVSGSASKWRTVHDIVSNGDLYVGYYGTGSLSIINGGYAANDGTANIGDYPGSVGAVTVDGSGSTWCPASLSVGNRGSGRLSITRGGSVWDAGSLALGTGSAVVSISGGGTLSATSVAIGRSSLLSIDVGRGSFLMVSGTAPPTNSGTIRIVAGAGVPANVVFAPIYLNKYVPCQTVGGTCNYYNYFTASSVTSGTSGSPISLNLASSQRALVRDNGTGWRA